METLVIDVGTTMFGIFFVKKAVYVPYVLDDRRAALYLLQNADEVVTYNGTKYDLTELGKLAGLTDELPLKGFHTDMARICWGMWRYYPESLANTYRKNFESCPTFPDTYEANVERDVYMTFKLWESWKAGKLKTLDGYEHR
jgi:hypothetical protein